MNAEKLGISFPFSGFWVNLKSLTSQGWDAFPLNN
jgi:hypothetical protein